MRRWSARQQPVQMTESRAHDDKLRTSGETMSASFCHQAVEFGAGAGLVTALRQVVEGYAIHANPPPLKTTETSGLSALGRTGTAFQPRSYIINYSSMVPAPMVIGKYRSCTSTFVQMHRNGRRNATGTVVYDQMTTSAQNRLTTVACCRLL